MELYIFLITSSIQLVAALVVAVNCFAGGMPVSSSYSVISIIKESLKIIRKLKINRRMQIQKVLNLRKEIKNPQIQLVGKNTSSYSNPAKTNG
jgi:hypothetical protein